MDASSDDPPPSLAIETALPRYTVDEDCADASIRPPEGLVLNTSVCLLQRLLVFRDLVAHDSTMLSFFTVLL